MPGACAPSTTESIPRAASAATMRSSGRIRAVGLVMWSSRARRVRGVTPASTVSTIAWGSATGNGSVTVTTRAPLRSATKSSVLRQAW